MQYLHTYMYYNKAITNVLHKYEITILTRQLALNPPPYKKNYNDYPLFII